MSVIALAVKNKIHLAPLVCAGEMLPLNRDPKVGEMSIFGDRTDKARFAEGSILFLVFVALVAAVTIVLFSVSSISLLDTSKETLTQSRSDNSPPAEKVIGSVVSPMDSDASPVPAQTESPSASNADNMLSSTPVPPSSGMLTEETLAAAALKPTPEREASATAVETSNGSTRAPSADETPPELSPSQEVRASPASIAEGVTAFETSNGSTRAPSADETPPELSPSQEVTASPASIAEASNPAQGPSGATMPILAIYHEERNSLLEDFEMQRHHASLDEGSVAFAPQIKERTGSYGSSAGPESKPPVRHAASRGRGTGKAGNIAKRLNRAELNRLVQRQGSLALSVAR